ncbi:MAG: ComF family protein, partial [Candidatus Eisenbacteria sp.]|nr:ComF family protein [Candidatus Eisenbacteria bacterium]
SLALPEPPCPRATASAAARVFYALEFEGAARAMIHALKYQGRTSIARDLARLAVPAALCACVTPPDVVVPIPLHPVRFRQRGFNQSELLAVHLAARIGAPMRRALVRARHTQPQAGLARRQRLDIAPDTFRAQAGIAGSGRILLVDDVATTGATLAAASVELLRTGAAEVVCFALAGTPPGDRTG